VPGHEFKLQDYKKKKKKKKLKTPGMVVYICNPSTRETKAGGDQSQSEQHSKTPQKSKK
jgi:hypothetical protein